MSTSFLQVRASPRSSLAGWRATAAAVIWIAPSPDRARA